MINFLSPQEKENVIKEKKFRIVLTLGFVFLFFFCCLSLVLILAAIIIGGEAEAQKIVFEQRERKLSSPQMKEAQRKLNEYNQVFSGLDSFYEKQIIFSDIVKKINSVLPENVYLEQISVSPENEDDIIASCIVGGFSPDRNSLISLKTNLEAKSYFTDIVFPSKLWAVQKDISFTVNFKVKR